MKILNKIKNYFKVLWLDITNKTDERGFTKVMRQQKRKLDKLHKQRRN